jgi:hypothetical protein
MSYGNWLLARYGREQNLSYVTSGLEIVGDAAGG